MKIFAVLLLASLFCFHSYAGMDFTGSSPMHGLQLAIDALRMQITTDMSPHNVKVGMADKMVEITKGTGFEEEARLIRDVLDSMGKSREVLMLLDALEHDLENVGAVSQTGSEPF